MRKKMLVGCTANCCILMILFFVWKRTEYFPYMFQEKTEYGYSLEEIRERLEYVYLLDNTPEPRSERYYGELGSLPQENAVNLQLYLARGNRILFLPESKANVKIEKDGRTYNAYYSKKMQGYLFYLLCDWQTYEAGIPVNSPESSSILCCMATNEKNADKVDACSKKGMDVYDTKELFYLGEVQVDLSDAMLSSRSPIEVHDNIYVNDVVGYVADTLVQAGEYGKYNIYLNRLHRIQDDKYRNGWTTSNIDCVIEGNGRQEYAQFIIYDGGDLDERVFPLSGPHLEDSLGYFSDYFSEEENRELIEKITKQPRGEITLEVRKQEKEEVRASKEYDEPDNNSEINFDIMPVEDIARKLSYACSYSNWFGMAELGAPVGTVRRFDGQEVIMYLWDYEKGLLFIPMNNVNAQLQGAGETLCPVYINDRGYMEFYQLNSNQFADGSGQLDTSMITIKEYETRLATSLIKQESRVKIRLRHSQN